MHLNGGEDFSPFLNQCKGNAVHSTYCIHIKIKLMQKCYMKLDTWCTQLQTYIHGGSILLRPTKLRGKFFSKGHPPQHDVTKLLTILLHATFQHARCDILHRI